MHFQRRDSNPPIQIIAGGKDINTKPFAKGGGKPQVIKKDQAFAGRTQGGGTRKQIYGTRDYGSGYPGGSTLRGTSSRGFPFYFWPVIWANPFSIDAADAYLHPAEYGLPDNTTRPGGPLATLTYMSSTPPGSTFRVLTDFASAESLISSLSICSSFVNMSSASPSPYLEHAPSPLPEQTLQYYRASSVALTLDDYNNTAALLPQASSDSFNVLLPSNTDVKLLRCLNTTIGSAVPLYDPPKGLNGDQIFLIVAGSIFAAVFAAILVPVLCGLCLQSYRALCRRRRCYRHEARRKPSEARSTIPCDVHPVSAPPPAVIVLPLNGEPLSSGKAGEMIEVDDLASITKNAQAFAGAEYDAPDDRDRHDEQTLWRWVPFKGRKTKTYEDIEMKGKN